jgi:hypothetical protein
MGSNTGRIGAGRGHISDGSDLTGRVVLTLYSPVMVLSYNGYCADIYVACLSFFFIGAARVWQLCTMKSGFDLGVLVSF